MSLNRFWLRLVRQGNTIVGYTSANGINWGVAMQVNVSMGSCLQAGLIATNGNEGSEFSATIGNVDVSGLMFRPEGFSGIETAIDAQIELLSMYPNPGSDIISVKWADVPESEWKIIVTDAVGRIIRFENGELISGGYYELDMRGKSPGLYFVKCISQKHGEIVKKLVIQR